MTNPQSECNIDARKKNTYNYQEHAVFKTPQIYIFVFISFYNQNSVLPGASCVISAQMVALPKTRETCLGLAGGRGRGRIPLGSHALNHAFGGARHVPQGAHGQPRFGTRHPTCRGKDVV